MRVEVEAQGGGDHSSDTMASLGPDTVCREVPAPYSDLVATTQEELIPRPTTGPIGLITTDTHLPDNEECEESNAVPSDSSQVIDSEDVRGVHESSIRTPSYRPRPVESPQEYAGSVSDC